MGSTHLPPQGLVHDPVPSGQREALLGLIGATPVDWKAAADLTLEDPAFLYALLHAVPLAAGRIEAPLREQVAERLETLGADLLNAWLLSRGSAAPSRTDHALRTLSAHAAVIARALAEAIEFPRPDEAVLACLWSRLAQLLQLSPEQGAGVLPTRVLNARLAEACGGPPPLIDALLLLDAPEEQAAQVHPLAAIVWGATRLAADSALERVESVARVCRVPAHVVADLARQQSIPDTAVTVTSSQSLTAGTSPQGADPQLSRLFAAALGGFARSAFDGLTPDTLRRRYLAACRLLGGLSPALVIVARGDHLETLPLGQHVPAAAEYDAGRPPLDDEASVVALAIRSHSPTSHQQNGDDTPGRSVRDWQLARWLGRSRYVCIPFASGDTQGAIVVAPDRAAAASDTARILVTLTSAASAVALAQQERETYANALREASEQAHRNHIQRIAHEARNPLSVIRNYLHLIPERHQAPDLAEDLRIVQDEIDRLGTLIDAATRPPAPESETPECHVAELLHDLRAMVGESLFGRRGIHFELRTLPALPPVAIPPSALRQVLLNLLHNAADVLHPGGRCTVALAGELISDGKRCLEIRVIDNGPGLPPERLADLFAPQPSAKGGHHQGIGLSITREILERWQARILCRSQHAVGTSFQLLVPLHVSE